MGYYRPTKPVSIKKAGVVIDEEVEIEDEFVFPYGVIILSDEEEFLKGIIGEIRISWSSSPDAFFYCMLLAGHLNANLFDGEKLITFPNIGETLYAFRNYSKFIDGSIGTIKK